MSPVLVAQSVVQLLSVDPLLATQEHSRLPHSATEVARPNLLFVLFVYLLQVSREGTCRTQFSYSLTSTPATPAAATFPHTLLLHLDLRHLTAAALREPLRRCVSARGSRGTPFAPCRRRAAFLHSTVSSARAYYLMLSPIRLNGSYLSQ